MDKDLTIKDILDTMTQAQKNTLRLYIGAAIRDKTKVKPPYAAIESFDENQKKVFYYLIGCALEKELNKELDLGTLEIVKGDN